MRPTTAATSLRLLLVASLVLPGLGCADSTSPGIPTPPQRFSVTQASQTLMVPLTLQLSTQGGSEAGAIGWESSDRSVVSVSEGLVTARFPGSATITARRGAESATVTFRVTAASIEVGPSTVVMPHNGTRLATATARDANGAALVGVPVSWRSGNALVAAVDSGTGLIRGVAPGVTTITASGGGTTGAVRVQVDPVFGAPLVFSTVQGSIGLHACGLEARTGLAYCWGDNEAGALGAGERAPSEFPVSVSGGRRFTGLSVGYYATCGIETGTALAYCWGSNENGDLGDGSLTVRWEPTEVAGGIRFAAISASGSVTCGIEAQTGRGYCWGNLYLVGDGLLVPKHPTPEAVAGGLHFSSISASYHHACGLESGTGFVVCWGSNAFGQLGDGTRTNRSVPTRSADGRRFSSVDADDEVTCGLEAQTSLAYCWGRNSYAQVGDGTTTDRLLPTPAGGGRRFTSIDAGLVTCGIEETTSVVYCWGWANPQPALVGDGTLRVSTMSADNGGACAVEAGTGLGYCWTHTLEPVPVPPPLAPSSATSKDAFELPPKTAATTSAAR